MSALQEAVRLTKRATPRVRASREETAAALNVAKKKYKQLFAIEEDAKTALKEEIARLSGYLPFDMECLEWRHKNGLPKLVLFSLEDPEFSIFVWQNHNFRVTPHLPKGLSGLYDDVVVFMRNRRDRSDVSITARFSGAIPDEAREKIAEAERFFEEVFLVAEPKRMRLVYHKPMPASLPRDPIAVGWDGAKLWYICDFDVTPIEEAALLIGPANKRKS